MQLSHPNTKQLRFLTVAMLFMISLTTIYAVSVPFDIAVQGGQNQIETTLTQNGVGTVADPVQFVQETYVYRYSYVPSSSNAGCDGEVNSLLQQGIFTESRIIPGAGSNNPFDYDEIDSFNIELKGNTGFVGPTGFTTQCDYTVKYELDTAKNLASDTQTITATQGIIDLGPIQQLAGAGLGPGEEYVVISREGTGLMWVGQPNTARSRKTTRNAADRVFICEDANQDNACDNTSGGTAPTTPTNQSNSSTTSTPSGNTTGIPGQRPTRNTTLPALNIMLIPAGNTGSSASWSKSLLKFTRDSVVANGDFCRQDSQCLISAEGDDSKDGNIAEFFQNNQFVNQPKCVDDGQHLLEHVCRNGQWRSRASELFVQLAALGDQSGQDYSVSCSTPADVFNDITFVTSQQVPVTRFVGRECNPYSSIDTYPCINNACVYQGPNGIGFGVSLNEPLNSPNSFLNTLNLSETFCDNVPQGSGFAECSPGTLATERLYYNPADHTLILLQNDQLPAINIAQEFTNIVESRFADINRYAQSLNAPDLDKGYFTRPQTFEHIGITKIGNKEIFGYKNTDKTQFRYDYSGIKYENVDLGINVCDGFIKQFDDKAFCEAQPTPDTTFIIGQSIPGNRTLSSVWIDLISKVRP